MIQSTKGKLAKQAYNENYGKGFPSDIRKRTEDLFTLLEGAEYLKDLEKPAGNCLEQLIGDRQGQHSIRINRKWRICFVWTPVGPEEVEITNYH